MRFLEENIPTRAEILEHSNHGDINALSSWMDSLNLPVGAREAILSDLASYFYTEGES